MTNGSGKAAGFVIKFFLIVFCIVNIFNLIKYAALSMFGDTAPAIDTDAEFVEFIIDEDADSDSQYRWNVAWTFEADGKIYSGSELVAGSRTNVEYGNTVHYFSFAPQINSINVSERSAPQTLFRIIFVTAIVLMMIFDGKTKKPESRWDQLPEGLKDTDSTDMFKDT